ncbi:MAG: alpha/beta hydrolase [Fusicatenibacter sp.]
MSEKIAVLFPGIGYTCDKPLLYYAGKIAAGKGYKVMPVAYSGFPSGVKGNKEKMEQAFYSALEQAEEILKDVDWEKLSEILLISKSVGTIVSSAYKKKYGLKARNILFTPLEETFIFTDEHGIVFHGTQDPWAKTEAILRSCRKANLPLFVTEGGNHSLETGEVMKDLKTLETIMRQVDDFL